jgi:uncharacterized protein
VKVVFDSSVYVSALATPDGVAGQALVAAAEGRFQPALSQPVLMEVLAMLSRKFAHAPEQLARAALFMASAAEMVKPIRRIDALADEPDNRVLECAAAANADVIVTGDRAMLALGTFEGIAIVSLRQFVDGLGHSRALHESRAPYGRAPRKSRQRRQRTETSMT